MQAITVSQAPLLRPNSGIRQPQPAAEGLAAATLAQIRRGPLDTREIASVLQVKQADLYPVLTRLKRDGVIAPTCGGASRAVWSITA